MEKIIQYFGKPCKVACDENCKKAWGLNSRPKEIVSDVEDDVVWLADSELGEAPDDPGTYEGGHAKPTCRAEMLNKWCVRECERSERTLTSQTVDHEIKLPDWSKRLYNIPTSNPLNA